MNKKILSLILVAMVSSTALISCGTKAGKDTSSTKSTESTESTESNQQTPSGDPAASPTGGNSASSENKSNNSSVLGENSAPTVEVTQVATVADFKDKDATAIQAVLGDPVSQNGNTSTYEKDNYTFEVTYYDSICGQVKITPKTEMKYPADANNVLKVLGINAVDSDSVSPSEFSWDNKFDTYKISVLPNASAGDKLGYVQVILAEQYK